MQLAYFKTRVEPTVSNFINGVDQRRAVGKTFFPSTIRLPRPLKKHNRPCCNMTCHDFDFFPRNRQWLRCRGNADLWIERNVCFRWKPMSGADMRPSICDILWRFSAGAASRVKAFSKDRKSRWLSRCCHAFETKSHARACTCYEKACLQSSEPAGAVSQKPSSKFHGFPCVGKIGNGRLDSSKYKGIEIG